MSGPAAAEGTAAELDGPAEDDEPKNGKAAMARVAAAVKLPVRTHGRDAGAVGRAPCFLLPLPSVWFCFCPAQATSSYGNITT
eukprot:scaffold15582_cov104-Isochrysis_galbana.AAC.3